MARIPKHRDLCSFKQNERVKSSFKEIRPVSKSFVIKEMMVWLEVQGLPLCTWTSVAFKKVAASYGDVMFMDSDLEEQKSFWLCVCVCKIHKCIFN